MATIPVFLPEKSRSQRSLAGLQFMRLQKNETQLSDLVRSLNCVLLFETSMDCSTLGLAVHHQLPEFTQTHVH